MSDLRTGWKLSEVEEAALAREVHERNADGCDVLTPTLAPRRLDRDEGLALLEAGATIDSLQREVANLRKDKRLWRIDALKNTVLVNEVVDLRRKLLDAEAQAEAAQAALNHLTARGTDPCCPNLAAAVAEEREGCAKLAESHRCSAPAHTHDCLERSEMAEIIASAIRARGEPAPQTPPVEVEPLRWLISHERECDHCCVEVGEMARLALGEPRKP